MRNSAKKRVLLTIECANSTSLLPVRDLIERLWILSLTTAVLNEAIASNASVIVSYHPPIFRGLKTLTLKTPLQSTLLQCAAHGISIYSPHSALDSVRGGINDWLADGVLHEKENGSILALLGDKLSPDGVVEGGEGRLVTFNSAITMSALENRIKEHLKLPQSKHPRLRRSGSLFPR